MSNGCSFCPSSSVRCQGSSSVRSWCTRFASITSSAHLRSFSSSLRAGSSQADPMGLFKSVLLIVAVIAVGFVLTGYRQAVRDPVVRTTQLSVAGLTEPVRILFISDVHVQGPDMTPERLARIL